LGRKKVGAPPYTGLKTKLDGVGMRYDFFFKPSWKFIRDIGIIISMEITIAHLIILLFYG